MGFIQNLLYIYYINMASDTKFGEISFKKRFTYLLKSDSIDNGQAGLFIRFENLRRRKSNGKKN